MAAMMGSTRLGLKKTGTAANVPNNPKAKLMYYLSCVSTLFDMKDSAEIGRLTNYANYYLLSDEDVTTLIVLCLLLKPDELCNKVMFQNDQLCGDSSNEFYELSAVSRTLMVAESIVIGGERKRVHKIMTFKMSWLRNNYIEPIKSILESRSAEERRRQEQRRQNNDCCVM